MDLSKSNLLSAQAELDKATSDLEKKDRECKDEIERLLLEKSTLEGKILVLTEECEVLERAKTELHLMVEQQSEDIRKFWWTCTCM